MMHGNIVNSFKTLLAKKVKKRESKSDLEKELGMSMHELATKFAEQSLTYANKNPECTDNLFKINKAVLECIRDAKTPIKDITNFFKECEEELVWPFDGFVILNKKTGKTEQNSHEDIAFYITKGLHSVYADGAKKAYPDADRATLIARMEANLMVMWLSYREEVNSFLRAGISLEDIKDIAKGHMSEKTAKLLVEFPSLPASFMTVEGNTEQTIAVSCLVTFRNYFYDERKPDKRDYNHPGGHAILFGLTEEFPKEHLR